MEQQWARMLADTQEAADEAAELNRTLATPEAAADARYYLVLQRRYARLLPWATAHNALRAAVEALAANRQEQALSDQELLPLYKQEEQALLQAAAKAAAEVQSLLRFIADGGTAPCVLTVRAQSGDSGFAVLLVRMYAKYLQTSGFEYTVQETAEGGEIAVSEGALGRLRHESGLHRRQDGADATVAVMPQAPQGAVVLHPEELRIDIFCSSGKGGQNINKVETAVRVTHLPTGLVVTCQDERSQLQNKKRALAILTQRLQAARDQAAAQRYVQQRDSQVRDRSHPIRRYDDNRNVVRDTRTDATVSYKEAMRGNIDRLVQAAALLDLP